jgi:pimeloyl-ACP methyl ester carboxylesterase
MQKAKVNLKGRKKSVRFFCLTLAILFVSSLFIWGFQTSWGKIKVKRLTIMGNDGTEISTLIYIPENATKEIPVPGIVIYHGRSNQGHSNDTWSMELARRGYVVLSPDLSGGGESDVNDRNEQAYVVAEYASTLDIIQPGNLNAIGYSAGCSAATQAAVKLPDKFNSSLCVFGPFLIAISGYGDQLKDITTNFGIIKAVEDQYDYHFLGNPEESRMAASKMFGFDEMVNEGEDYAFGDEGNIFRYVEVSGALHQTANISTDAISAILEFEETVTDAPISLAVTDQAWKAQQFFSAIAAIAMLFFLAAGISLLLELEFFSSLISERKTKAPQKGAKAWALDILFSLVIPAIIFVPISAYAMAFIPANKILSSANLNGIMVWLIAMAIIGSIRLSISINKRKKAGEKIDLSDFALGSPGETKINWSNVGKSVLIGVVVVTVCGLIMTVAESLLGVNYQIWNLATYLKPSMTRVIRAIPYMIIIFVVMFIGNLNQRSLPSLGSEKKDMILAMTVNALLTASALIVLLLIQYGGSLIIGTGQTLIPQIDVYGTGTNTSCGALDFSFGYCYMMGGTTAVITYIYRKYGNIWAGVIPCAIFAGLFTLIGFTLVI